MSQFKEKSSDKYSRAMIAAGNASASDAARITRGIWRTTSARYKARADEMAESGGDPTEITRLNCRTVFWRAAVTSLLLCGRMHIHEMHVACVFELVASLTYQIPDSDSRSNFEEDICQQGLIFLPVDAPEEVVEAFLEAIARLAKNRYYVDAADPSIVLSIYREVRGRVDTDLANTEISVQYTIKRVVSADPIAALRTLSARLRSESES